MQTDREKRIWLAAMFDAEGSIGITAQKQLKVGFGMKVNEPLIAFEHLFRPASRTIDKKGFFRLFYYDNDASELMSLIWEFLIEKQKIAKITANCYPCARGKKRSSAEIALALQIRIFIQTLILPRIKFSENVQLGI